MKWFVSFLKAWKVDQMSCPNPNYDYADFEDSDDGYDAVKDNYLTNGGYGYNDRTRQEDKDWHDECRRNERWSPIVGVVE